MCVCVRVRLCVRERGVGVGGRKESARAGAERLAPSLAQAPGGGWLALDGLNASAPLPTMRLDTRIELLQDYKQEECYFWARE